MEVTNNIRQRTRGLKPNGIIEQSDEKNQDPEFIQRESPLTVLIKTSLHIRAIYHIFVVILLMLLFDTVVYDLVDRGKINIATSTVVYGFGDIGRGTKLWLFEFSVALAFYPGFRLYIAGARLFRNYSGARRLWNVLFIAGLACLQAALVAVPVWDLGRQHLAPASAVAVTCEMFRFAMKIHAVAVACAPRWRNPRAAIPTFNHYLYYLFAPTLIYRDQYPRTKKIRWSSVIFNFMEVAAIIFYNSFLWERFILPYWSEYGKETKQVVVLLGPSWASAPKGPTTSLSVCGSVASGVLYVGMRGRAPLSRSPYGTPLPLRAVPKVEAGTVVRGMFACVLPGVISFLCGFYCLLHAWLNAFAEMLKFADRLFYEEWWTTSQFSEYYRAWNRVVHSWLRDHIYKPLIPVTGRAVAIFAVFFVSAIAHEVILALSFGFFYPVLMMQFGVLGVLLVPITADSGRRYPSFMNLLMWLAFFFGNGILWSLYPMEYFARKNCPPSENDSFFVPKSWTCPEIVLKPNWTLQTPFSTIFIP